MKPYRKSKINQKLAAEIVRLERMLVSGLPEKAKKPIEAAVKSLRRAAKACEIVERS